MLLALNSDFGNLLPSASVAWLVGLGILTAVINICFALAVHDDSRRFGDKTVFVGGGIWALATLVGGVSVAAIYWVMHHSTLRSKEPISGAPESPKNL